MAKQTPEKMAGCPACGKFFPVDQLRDHLNQCPEMPQLEKEIPERGRNLRKQVGETFKGTCLIYKDWH